MARPDMAFNQAHRGMRFGGAALRSASVTGPGPYAPVCRLTLR